MIPFFILHWSYFVVQYEHIRILLCWSFTRHIWETVFFFCSLEKSTWYVPAKYWNKQHRSKYISPIFILQLIFAFPQNSYFHIIFTIVVLAQIRKIICWGKRIKGTQMSQFLYLSIQDCQTWKEIYLEKLNVRTSIRICKIYRINTVNQ